MSLFENLGGEAAVNAAVDIFYKKVLADSRISHFFAGLDMDRQRVKQKAFLTYAFGGPNNYTGKNLRAAHARLKLTDADFDAVLEALGATLKELGVSDALVGEAAAVAESTRKDVLGR